MQLVCARLETRIDDSPRGVAELRAVVSGGHLELSKRIGWRTHYVTRATQVIHAGRVVVDAVENEIILFRTLTIRDKIAFACATRTIGRRNACPRGARQRRAMPTFFCAMCFNPRARVGRDRLPPNRREGRRLRIGYRVHVS